VDAHGVEIGEYDRVAVAENVGVFHISVADVKLGEFVD
jgi:hypothetical protein